jgi:hypothetical protein
LVDNGVTVLWEARSVVRGLEEMWIGDQEGMRIILIEIPEEHPLHWDLRHLAGYRGMGRLLN